MTEIATLTHWMQSGSILFQDFFRRDYKVCRWLHFHQAPVRIHVTLPKRSRMDNRKNHVPMRLS